MNLAELGWARNGLAAVESVQMKSVEVGWVWNSLAEVGWFQLMLAELGLALGSYELGWVG